MDSLWVILVFILVGFILLYTILNGKKRSTSPKSDASFRSTTSANENSSEELQRSLSELILELRSRDEQIKKKDEHILELAERIEVQANQREAEVTERLNQFRSSELEAMRKENDRVFWQKVQDQFDKWLSDTEPDIRKDAIDRYKAENRGRIAEHFIPFHKEFRFNPQDVRFLGGPINLVVFHGLSEAEENIEIYFVEVMTGQGRLNKRQKAIFDAVENKRVYFLPITWDTEDMTGGQPRVSVEGQLEYADELKFQYSKHNKELMVSFENGQRATYYGVPEDKFIDFKNNSDKRKYLINVIAAKYRSSKSV